MPLSPPPPGPVAALHRGSCSRSPPRGDLGEGVPASAVRAPPPRCPPPGPSVRGRGSVRSALPTPPTVRSAVGLGVRGGDVSIAAGEREPRGGAEGRRAVGSTGGALQGCCAIAGGAGAPTWEIGAGKACGRSSWWDAVLGSPSQSGFCRGVLRRPLPGRSTTQGQAVGRGLLPGVLSAPLPGSPQVAPFLWSDAGLSLAAQAGRDPVRISTHPFLASALSRL